MALVLGLREGEDFYVGDERFVLVRQKTLRDFELLHEASGAVHVVTEFEAKEVLPSVLVSAGDPEYGMMSRVVIEAPRSQSIWRGKLYWRRRRQERKARCA